MDILSMTPGYSLKFSGATHTISNPISSWRAVALALMLIPCWLDQGEIGEPGGGCWVSGVAGVMAYPCLYILDLCSLAQLPQKTRLYLWSDRDTALDSFDSPKTVR